MKKVLTLVLVLAVAQLATAAVWWDVSDAGGGQFGVSLVADEDVQDVQIGEMLSSGTTFEVSPMEDSSVWAGNFGTTQGFYDTGTGGIGYAAGTNTEPGAFATGTLLSFTVTGDLGDVITLGSASGGYDSFIATQATGGPAGIESYDGGSLQSFELVPEPMTMALLGLGGLFVRRRRA